MRRSQMRIQRLVDLLPLVSVLGRGFYLGDSEGHCWSYPSWRYGAFSHFAVSWLGFIMGEFIRLKRSILYAKGFDSMVSNSYPQLSDL
jgi:hypothetical protein